MSIRYNYRHVSRHAIIKGFLLSHEGYFDNKVRLDKRIEEFEGRDVKAEVTGLREQREALTQTLPKYTRAQAA